MNFEAVIGLEIHIQMKTNSKMFSTAPVSFGNLPNTNVAINDLAFPGSMPVVNKQAVVNAIRLCHVMNMEIDDELWFDRKNYFYSDLPKGYQITQQKRPIGRNGYIKIETSNGPKSIHIERLHMEEDTGKQLHDNQTTYLDFNRAGIPLIELVTKPELRNGEEAMKFVEQIRSIVIFLGVSDGKMEEGSIRCDVNVSIRPIGYTGFGNKAEIKNLNSLYNIQKGIDYEIKRQEALLLSGNEVIQETRRFDESSEKTVSLRAKIDDIDYKYFTEPNIIPIKLSKEFIENAIKTSPELASSRKQRYMELGLNEYDANILTANKDISDYYDKVISFNADPKLSANWVNVDVQSVLNKQNISIKEFSVAPEHLAKLINLIENKIVSHKQARDIFNKMLLIDGKDPEGLLQSIGAGLISDEKVLLETIDKVLNDNPQSIDDYRKGKDRVLGYLVGQVMKLTQGKANPELTNKLLLKKLKGE